MAVEHLIFPALIVTRSWLNETSGPGAVWVADVPAMGAFMFKMCFTFEHCGILCGWVLSSPQRI